MQQPATIYNRECVFCGEKSTDSDPYNKEHVISDWALDLFGINKSKYYHIFAYYTSSEQVKSRGFNIGSFTIPAHERCNNHFGEQIEGPAASAMRKILSEEEVDAQDLSSIVNWIDKIRACLYFSIDVLEGNPANTVKSLNTAMRIGLNDRFCLIYRTNNDVNDIFAFGPSIPAAKITPTSLHFRIGTIGFLFCTDIFLCDNLLARRKNTRLFPSRSPEVNCIFFFQRVNVFKRLMSSTNNHEWLGDAGHEKPFFATVRDEKLVDQASVLLPKQNRNPQHILDLHFNLEMLRYLFITQQEYIKRSSNAGSPVSKQVLTYHNAISDYASEIVNSLNSAFQTRDEMRKA